MKKTSDRLHFKEFRRRGTALGLVRLGAGVALAAAFLMTPEAANAQFFGFGQPYRGYGYGYGRYRPYADPYYFRPQQQQTKRAATPKKDKNKEATVKRPPGPLLITISLHSQHLTLYANGEPIAHSPVSTGTAEHPTPTGIFSVIGKEKFHRSNLYSNAPMPFMQRITWSGVALHQGVLPGYPASHGCIRMPTQFAQYLWATTRMGARVIITRDDVTPFDIAHAKLFTPPKPDDAQVQANAATKIAETNDPVKSTDAPRPAANPADQPANAPGATPVGLVTTGAGAPASTRSVAPNSARDAAAPRPAARERSAGEATDAVDTRAPSPGATDAAPHVAPADNVDKKTRASSEAKDKPRSSAPVSVFISRKTNRLYVRQGFEPVFDMPVTIRDDAPLGTFLYTAVDFKDERTAMRWVAVPLTTPASVAAADARREAERHDGRQRKADRKKDEAPRPVLIPVRSAAAAALDRIDIPPETVTRISEMLSPGSSLIVSDLPYSNETGKYTDFIILTR